MRNKTPKIINEFDKITVLVFPYFASDQGFFLFQIYFYQFSLVFFCLFVCCRGSFRHLTLKHKFSCRAPAVRSIIIRRHLNRRSKQTKIVHLRNSVEKQTRPHVKKNPTNKSKTKQKETKKKLLSRFVRCITCGGFLFFFVLSTAAYKYSVFPPA